MSKRQLETNTISNKVPSTFVPMLIIGTLFFLFGVITWLNGSLIPFLRIVCNLTEFEALFVTFAFYIAYTLTALPSAIVLKKSGYKNGMAIGLGIMAIGAVFFIPAAYSKSYPIFLFALFLMGSGLTLLQTASNPYIVHIGSPDSAATRISIMGLLNKTAGVVAPAVFTAIVLTGMEQFEPAVLDALSDQERISRLAELSSRLVVPYIFIAIGLALLAVIIKLSPLQELQFEDEGDTDKVEREWDIIKFPQVILGSIALFAYVGVEVVAGDTIGLFGQNVGVAHFGSLTSYTMMFMVIGYIIGITCIPKLLSQQTALLGSALFGTLFVFGVMYSSPESTALADIIVAWIGVPTVPDPVMFLALLGLANALVWPAIWPLALEGLGKFTAIGSALLIMGIAGGAIIPLWYGHLAESGDPQMAYWMMLPSYAFIFFYAVKGHKMRSWTLFKAEKASSINLSAKSELK